MRGGKIKFPASRPAQFNPPTDHAAGRPVIAGFLFVVAATGQVRDPDPPPAPWDVVHSSPPRGPWPGALRWGAGKVKPGATTATHQLPRGLKVLLSQTWRSKAMRQRHRIMPLAGAAGAMCQIPVWHCKAAGAK